MSRAATRHLVLSLSLGLAASGCALLDADPTRVTYAELLTGAYDREQVTGFEVETVGLELDEAVSFCDAAASVPLRWTVDALVPMQVWVDTYSTIVDTPEAARPSVELLTDLAQRRLRWSLTGQGERPIWDEETVAAAETFIRTAITDCPDLPLVVGLPGRSDRPAGWRDMSGTEVAEHCASMALRFEQGVAEYEADHGRPPRHQMEMDLPTAYYGTSDYFGIVLDPDGAPMVVPVPGGACDL